MMCIQWKLPVFTHVGSNRAYLVVLDSNEFNVPKITAMRNCCGLSNPIRMLEKYGIARHAITIGVARAPIRQPRILIACTPRKITMHVENPTTDEKFPMKR